MKIKFIGATEGVTGSNYIVSTKKYNFLVDLGMYQGEKNQSENLEFNYQDIDFVILTHAHIDHIGKIPLLFKNGFNGKIYCSYETKYLSEILLKDSAEIQENETSKENEQRKKAGLPTKKPLYNLEDVQKSLSFFYPIDFEREINLDNIKFKLKKSNHILGSASVDLKVNNKNILFSGDLGTRNNNLYSEIKPFEKNYDYLILESTYGNDTHPNKTARRKNLKNLILKIYNKKEIGLIPTFAVGRLQNLIIEIKEILKDDKTNKFKDIKFFIDSPLGKKATDIYKEYFKEIDFSSENIFWIDNLKETFKILKSNEPKIILSSSGMCSGGKILFYLKKYLEMESTNIIFVGYQAEDTLGRDILEKETVKIKEKIYDVKSNIHNLKGFSAHADQKDLFKYISNLNNLKKIFLTHGEKET
ncbi:MAG: MBL fold metallo-hydrolase, partial [Bacillota bacterium]